MIFKTFYWKFPERFTFSNFAALTWRHLMCYNFFLIINFFCVLRHPNCDYKRIWSMKKCDRYRGSNPGLPRVDRTPSPRGYCVLGVAEHSYSSYGDMDRANTHRYLDLASRSLPLCHTYTLVHLRPTSCVLKSVWRWNWKKLELT